MRRALALGNVEALLKFLECKQPCREVSYKEWLGSHDTPALPLEQLIHVYNLYR